MHKSSYFPFILCFVMLTVFSCTTDDSGEITLIGEWEALKEVTYGCDNEDNDHIVDFFCPVVCSRLTITEDGGYTLTIPQQDDVVGTYVVMDNTLEVCEESVGCRTFTYELDAKNLTLTIYDEGTGCTVTATYKK